MNIEAFFDLIRSRDISNVEIAWQIARGMRDDGDKDFEAFVKAIYGWALSDLPSQKPVDFLANLYQAKLKCNILRKAQIPSVSYTMSPLVEKAEIGDIQTATFPKGFEVFDRVTEFQFGTQTLKTLGDELAGLKKLEKLIIDSRYAFEFLPEFAACESIKRLHVSTWTNDIIKFPTQISEMPNIEELGLLTHRIEGPVWEAKQLKSLLLSTSNYEFSWNEVNPFWEKMIAIEGLEKLTLKLSDLSVAEKKVPSYIFQNTKLKELHFLSKYRNQVQPEFPSELGNMINLLELTVPTLSDREIEIVAHLPRLYRLNIGSKSTYKYIAELMESYGAQVDVILV